MIGNLRAYVGRCGWVVFQVAHMGTNSSTIFNFIFFLYVCGGMIFENIYCYICQVDIATDKWCVWLFGAYTT